MSTRTANEVVRSCACPDEELLTKGGFLFFFFFARDAGPDGEFLCNSCGLQSAKKAKGDKKRTKDGKQHTTSERLRTKKDKKVKREQEKENHEEEEDVEEEDEDDDDDDDEEEEDSPWICCDSCGQWLLAKGMCAHVRSRHCAAPPTNHTTT
jgi:hypothetical protein